MYEIYACTVAAPNFEVRLSMNRSNLKECKALSSCSVVQLKNVRRGPFCSLKCSYTWLSFISLSLLLSSKCPPWNLKLPKNRIITGVSLSCSAFGFFFFVLNNNTMTKTKSILNRKIEIESINANANDWWNKINELDEWHLFDFPCCMRETSCLAKGSCFVPSLMSAKSSPCIQLMAASSAFRLKVSATKLAFPGLYSST